MRAVASVGGSLLRDPAYTMPAQMPYVVQDAPVCFQKPLKKRRHWCDRWTWLGNPCREGKISGLPRGRILARNSGDDPLLSTFQLRLLFNEQFRGVIAEMNAEERISWGRGEH